MRCAYDMLAVTVGHLDGGVIGQLGPCDDPAEHLAIWRRDVLAGDDADSGYLKAELSVTVCAGHDRLISLNDGYVRSIKLRYHSPT